MSTNPRSPAGPKSPEPLQPLVERVRARVAEVGLALNQRSRGSRPRSNPDRKQRAVRGSPVTTPSADDTREARSLRRVFHEMGHAHRRHRRQTGQQVSAPLRSAAEEFRRAPSLTSLVAVAAFLDAEGSLAW